MNDDGLQSIMAAVAAQRESRELAMDGHEWGPEEPLPPAAAVRSPEWAVLSRKADNRKDAMRAAQREFYDSCKAYAASVEELKAWRTEVIALIGAARPELKAQCIKWDPDTNTLQVATKHDHPTPGLRAYHQPEWARKLAEDLNAQVADGTYTPEAPNGID